MLLPLHDDPIVAIATAPGRGAVGIVRVSGRSLHGLAKRLLGHDLVPRHASFLPFRDAGGSPIDHGIAIYFPAPASYTGQDVLELHAHGGPIVLQLLLARVLQLGTPELRLARPGEFTERAYLNGKLDLAQAEAVMDLIDAGTEAAARSASRSLAGALSAEVRTLSDALVELRALVESTLDFPDEEIDFLQEADARGRLQQLLAQVDATLDRTRQGVLLREGIRVVIAGQPNVGKSSLLNALAGAELAIVTPVAGTTRDRISETVQIDGVPIHIVDTAGLRDVSDDEVERIGIARSWEAAEGADAVMFVRDLSRRGNASYDAADASILGRLQQIPRLGPKAVHHVWNKGDLAGAGQSASPLSNDELVVSARTGDGLLELRTRLLAVAGWQAQPEGLFSARARHVSALRQCRAHVEAAVGQLDSRVPAFELMAEELRLAHEALGQIVGAYSADELLGEIFGRFCIGK